METVTAMRYLLLPFTRRYLTYAGALVAVEIWFADEARVSQKNKLARRWAKRGSRPSAPKDQRIASNYIFGAISPKDGKGAALVLPKCDTYAMNLHLAEIAKNVAPGAHAVLLLDQAGWHMTDKLDLPANITIVPLPPKCPELNPTENVWQFLRENWLSNRIFKSYDDILDHCCDAWNSSISLGASCPSSCAIGPIGSDQRGLVLRLQGLLDGERRVQTRGVWNLPQNIFR